MARESDHGDLPQPVDVEVHATGVEVTISVAGECDRGMSEDGAGPGLERDDDLCRNSALGGTPPISRLLST